MHPSLEPSITVRDAHLSIVQKNTNIDRCLYKTTGPAASRLLPLWKYRSPPLQGVAGLPQWEVGQHVAAHGRFRGV